jgi:hypothetical protein
MMLRGMPRALNAPEQTKYVPIMDIHPHDSVSAPGAPGS